MDRKYVMTGLGYAILGMLLGIMMASSKDHGQMPTHAHIMLVGFVVSFIYALCHKLWLGNPTSLLSTIQFYVHQAGALIMVIGLFLYYGNYIALEKVDPFLAVSSLLVLAGMVLMKVMFIKSRKLAVSVP
jgi:putative solute:sodium symporter small subunit